MTEEEMVGWHHQHNGNESEKNPEYSSAEQGILVCCHPQGLKKSDRTE